MTRQYKEAAGIYLYKLVHDTPPLKFGIYFIFQKLVLALLHVLSFIYAILAKTKFSLYNYGILRKHELSCPVISFGNITLGGTGKTPAAKKLAAAIRDMGFRVAILNRGYRAGFKGQSGLVSDGEKIYMNSSQAGDEAYLLARSLPGVIIVVGSDRALSGRYATDVLKAQVVILDDGYQHWRLKRNLDIVLIDSMNPFGNKYVLPRGTLREPLKNLARADVFLLTKVDYNKSLLQNKDLQNKSSINKNTIKNELEKYNNKALIVESSHAPGQFININEWRNLPESKDSKQQDQAAPNLKLEQVLSFSAIGNPDSFVRTLNLMGINPVLNIAYPDHHEYTAAEMLEIASKAEGVNATALVTTEKDAVKIAAEFINAQKMLPLYVLPIEIDFYDGGEELLEIVKRTIKNFY